MDSSSSISKPTSCGTIKEKKKTWGAGGPRLSTDPQSVAARQRRHRISDRFKILQSLVPGGSKLDTVSMLEEAIQYVKFLKAQIWLHQAMIGDVDDDDPTSLTFKSCAVTPVVNHNDDLCNNYSGDRVDDEVQPEFGPPDSWFSVEGNK